MLSWVSPNLFCLFILPFVWNITVLWLCPVPFSIILWKSQFPFLKETLMIMRGFELFKQKGSLSQFCVLLLIKTSCVHLHHNAPYGLGCWHSAKGRGNWKSSPFFKGLTMDLQKCNLSDVKFSRITGKNPWKHVVESQRQILTWAEQHSSTYLQGESRK